MSLVLVELKPTAPFVAGWGQKATGRERSCKKWLLRRENGKETGGRADWRYDFVKRLSRLKPVQFNGNNNNNTQLSLPLLFPTGNTFLPMNFKIFQLKALLFWVHSPTFESLLLSPSLQHELTWVETATKTIIIECNTLPFLALSALLFVQVSTALFMLKLVEKRKRDKR